MTTSVFPEGWQRVQKYTYNYIAGESERGEDFEDGRRQWDE